MLLSVLFFLASFLYQRAGSQILDSMNIPRAAVALEKARRDFSTCTAATGCFAFEDRIGLEEKEQRHFASPLVFRTIQEQDSLLVGAMDAAYVLNYELDLVGKVNLSATRQEIRLCNDTILSFTSLTNLVDFRCHNHIRFFDLLEGQDTPTLISAGTGSYFYSTSYVKFANLNGTTTEVPATPEGAGTLSNTIVPSDPTLYYTGGVIKRDGAPVLVTGITVGSTQNDGLIGFHSLSITADTATITTTIQTVATEATFIGRPQLIVDMFFYDYTLDGEALESQDLMFVAFQESVDSRWASSIARICKNDVGSSRPSASGFLFPVTFVKAHISCKISPPSTLQLPYVYNRIFDFELVEQSRFAPGEDVAIVGYGLFVETGLQPQGSAVCVYLASRSSGGSTSNNGLYDIFTRQYVNGVDNDGLNCTDGGTSRQANQFANREIATPIIQLGDSPLFSLEGVSLVKLQVDPQQSVKRNGTIVKQDVMFAASDMGVVYKIFVAGQSHTPIISELIELNDTSRIYQMSLKNVTNSDKVLFVTTNTTVYRLPLNGCDRHTTCQDCVGVRDPYCAWNGSSCVFFQDQDFSEAQQMSLLQDVDDGSTMGCSPLPPVSSTPVQPLVSTVNVTQVLVTTEVLVTTVSLAPRPSSCPVSEIFSHLIFTTTRISVSMETVTECSLTATSTTTVTTTTTTQLPASTVLSANVGVGGVNAAITGSAVDPIIPVAIVGGLFAVMCIVLAIVLGAVCCSCLRLKKKVLSTSQQNLTEPSSPGTDDFFPNRHAARENGSAGNLEDV